jgi:hypothetical protein
MHLEYIIDTTVFIYLAVLLQISCWNYVNLLTLWLVSKRKCSWEPNAWKDAADDAQKLIDKKIRPINRDGFLIYSYI